MILPFFDHLPTSKWTFFTLNVDQNWHFLTIDPPHLDHVVFERPLGQKGYLFSSEHMKKQEHPGNLQVKLEFVVLWTPALSPIYTIGIWHKPQRNKNKNLTNYTCMISIWHSSADPWAFLIISPTPPRFSRTSCGMASSTLTIGLSMRGTWQNMYY